MRLELSNEARKKEGASKEKRGPFHERAAQGQWRIQIGMGELSRSLRTSARGSRGQWQELEALLADAEKHVPDDLAPYYRAADRILASGHDAALARRYFEKYASQEPEGDQPTLAEARAKLAAAHH